MPVYDFESLEGALKDRNNAQSGADGQQQESSPSPPLHVIIRQRRRVVAHDDANEERRYMPFLTPIILLANVAVFVFTMYLNNCPGNTVENYNNNNVKHSSTSCVLPLLHRFSFQPFQQNPLLGPSTLTLQKMGGLERSLILGKHHQAWRLFTCIWLHAGVFHILIDIIALLVVGIRLEIDFGALRIGSIYLLSGFGGSLLSAFFVENQISVGASGALFGLLGATLSEILTNWSRYEKKCAPIVTLLLLVLINLVFGLMPHVDNFAHIGGFVVGFLLGFVLLVRVQDRYYNNMLQDDKFAGIDDLLPGDAIEDQQQEQDLQAKIRIIMRKYKVYQIVCLVLSVILLLAFFVAGFVLLFMGIDPNKKCSWCHYLSCVPTSQWQCNNNNNSIPS
jgi:membrane associated rhomboid family serine protease